MSSAKNPREGQYNQEKEMKLTVIFRNDSPMIHCGDSPSYRSVQIELTPEQCALLKTRQTSTSCGNAIYEEISRCFFEPKEPE